jgi:hypothetical protein
VGEGAEEVALGLSERYATHGGTFQPVWSGKSAVYISCESLQLRSVARQRHWGEAQADGRR